MIPSTSRARPWVRAVTASWLIATLGGCTAQLDNPEAFSDRPRPGSEAGGSGGSGVTVGGGGSTSSAGSDTGGGSSAGSAGSNAGTGGSAGGSAGSSGTAGTGGLPSCVAALFVNGTGKCTSNACHAKTASPAAGLDLASAGVESRLVDQLAGHQGLDASAVCSKTDKLIDSADPSKSWVLKKIMGQQGSCGVRMPYGGTLSSAELTCMQTWIQSL